MSTPTRSYPKRSRQSTGSSTSYSTSRRPRRSAGGTAGGTKSRKSSHGGSGITDNLGIPSQKYTKVMRYPTSPLDEPYFGPSPTATYKIPMWVNITELTEEERLVYDAEEKKKEEQRIIWRKELERKQAEEDARKKELEGAEQTGDDSDDDESEGAGGDTTENDNESTTAAASEVEGGPVFENENKSINEDVIMGEDGAVTSTDINVDDSDTLPVETVITAEGESKVGVDSTFEQQLQLQQLDENNNEIAIGIAEPTNMEEIQPMLPEEGAAAIDDSNDEIGAVEHVSREGEHSASTIEAHAQTIFESNDSSSAPVLSIAEGSSGAAEEGPLEEEAALHMMDVENKQLQAVTGEENTEMKDSLEMQEEDLVSAAIQQEVLDESAIAEAVAEDITAVEPTASQQTEQTVDIEEKHEAGES